MLTVVSSKYNNSIIKHIHLYTYQYNDTCKKELNFQLLYFRENNTSKSQFIRLVTLGPDFVTYVEVATVSHEENKLLLWDCRAFVGVKEGFVKQRYERRSLVV